MKYLVLICCLLTISCKNSYFSSIDGQLLSVGIYPNETTLNVAQYLDGCKVDVKDISEIKYSYDISTTNNYFGLINTINNRHADIFVKPSCQTNNLICK